jgi:hypothetical protein
MDRLDGAWELRGICTKLLGILGVDEAIVDTTRMPDAL